MTGTFTAYTGVNCLRAAIGVLLQPDRIEQIPDPLDHYTPGLPGNRGFDINAFNDALEQQTGFGIRMVGFSECPPGGRLATKDWVAVVKTSHSEHELHAVACRGATALRLRRHLSRLPAVRRSVRARVGRGVTGFRIDNMLHRKLERWLVSFLLRPARVWEELD